MATAQETRNATLVTPMRRGRDVAQLPRLIDQRGITDELGVTSAAAEKIMRQVPKVHVPELRKVYVKRDDVLRLIEDGTRR